MLLLAFTPFIFSPLKQSAIKHVNYCFDTDSLQTNEVQMDYFHTVVEKPCYKAFSHHQHSIHI